jgi:GSCFA family
MLIEAEEAWGNLLTNEHSRWDKIATRFNTDFMSVVFAPKFKIAATDRFFCIGSCFARNVELELIYRDICVLSKRIICPKEEFSHRPTGLVNKYTTGSMLNEFKWALTPPRPQDVLIETDGGWADFQLATASPVSLARGIARRSYLMEDYFARLRQADVVVMTLGYVENWLDTATGFYLNVAPSRAVARRHDGRFRLERTDVATNLKHLLQIREILTELSPGARIVVTVSPVPMNATFSGDDVLVANMYSKATLRTAAQAFADAFADVEYFPSYELVMLSRREAAFKDDWIHVKDECVDHAMDGFIAVHLGTIPRRFPEFLDGPYLNANPDVEDAVRRGEIPSGYHHWIAHGQAEGRCLRP